MTFLCCLEIVCIGTQHALMCMPGLAKFDPDDSFNKFDALRMRMSIASDSESHIDVMMCRVCKNASRKA